MSATSGPVAVGGVGGSGTRVVASILDAAGVDMGTDLNESMDDLWFTILFKSRRVHERMHADRVYARRSFELYEKLATGRGAFSVWDRARMASSAVRVAARGHNHLGHGRGRWALRRLRSMLHALEDRPMPDRWGWKEPCTHLYVDLLADRWRDARYVHVVRDGRDMAYSGNVQDLYLWGPGLGILPPRGGDPDALVEALLRHWAAVNSRTLAAGPAALGDRFVVVRFEDFCAEPEATVGSLLERLDLAAGADAAALAALIEPPASLGRHHGREVPGLGPAEEEALTRLGYGP